MEFVLRINHQELQVLVAALHEAPYKMVAPLLNKLQTQVTEQEAAAVDKPATGQFGIPVEPGAV